MQKIAVTDIKETVKNYTGIINEYSINKKYFLRTFGCQLNENDSEKLAGMLDLLGFSETDDMEEANLIIFNTCTIRENANDKIFGNLGIVNSLKKADKSKIVVVCGCMMKEKINIDKVMNSYRFVDIIFGPSDLHRFPELLSRKILDLKRVCGVSEEDELAEGLPVKHKKKFRALCTIIYGCNNFCTYCIVPYVRGRERSREMANIIDELDSLGSRGYKEVMFLGQNVNSYGKDLPTGDFADLLEKAGDIRSIERIRFMTSHPKDINKKLIDVMSSKKNIMPHLHLPLQSGSDSILKKMNRGYTSQQFLDIVRYAKEKIPNITISTDIIVGFPGETEEDFQDTLDLIAEIRFDSAFTFQYSKREGTPAAKYDDQIPADVVTERFQRLLDLQNRISLENNQKMLNTVQEVLIEGPSEQRPEYLSGRTPENRLVNFSHANKGIPDPAGNPTGKPMNEIEDYEGRLALVLITGTQTYSLEGELLNFLD
ncbi:MAG: tRNA (N6-isopentenyl adenosine(37)-C2)-methylthiotransferase MiaB [Saccharofermentanales bacterium]